MTTPRLKRGLVETPDGYIHYCEAGDGAPLLLLHQVPLSSIEYLEVIEPLARTRRVIAPDLLGYGCSDAPARGMTIPDYAASLICLLDKLNVQRADVVGIHTGGVVANELAAGYPDRVRRLIIGGVAAWTNWQERYESFARCQPWLMDAEGATIKEQWKKLADLTSDETIIRRFIGEKLKANPIWYVGYVAVFTYDFVPRFEQIKAPIKLIVGEKDMLLEPTLALKERHPEVDFALIEGGSNWLTWETPQRLIEEIEKFLA